MKLSIALAAAALLASSAAAAGPELPVPAGVAGEFVTVPLDDPAVDGYSLRLPDGYDPSRTYPLLLSLHSSGQVGGPVEEALCHGPPSVIRRLPETCPESLRRNFILVSPHLTEGPYEERQWFDRLELLDDILSEVCRGCRVDPARIYLAGYSTGGTGTWGYASRRPGQFAAVIPIAGYTRPEQGIRKPIVEDWSVFRDLPVWTFYNASDRVVGFSHGRTAVAAIEALDGKPFLVLNHVYSGPDPYRGSILIDTTAEEVTGMRRILSVYRIGIHSEGRIWDNPVLYEWLLGHSNPDYRVGRLAGLIGQGP